MHRVIRRLLTVVSVLTLAFISVSARADIKGAISGTVTDSTGAILPGVSVTATEQATNVQSVTVTNQAGFYSFPALAVGSYNIAVKHVGFKDYVVTGIKIDANSAVRVDAALEVGSLTDVVTVQSEALKVETQSTQMGETIEAEKMTAVPLSVRSFIDLLALQPGVSPNTVTAFTTGTGIGGKTISGNLNDGNQSVNGGRPETNGFMVNGANAEEGAHEAAGMIPNLDSIQEFRIITNNYDAEYGNYSGGQVNVVTKSGTNNIHGNAFEFLRNTDFNAKNYINKTVSPYKQNQFGGTLGAPIIKNKIFGFIDYQGTRSSIASTVTYVVPPAAARTGDFSDPAVIGQLEKGVVGGSGSAQTAWATTLSNRLGYAVTQGEHYYTAGCVSTSQCVFPNAQIPSKAWDAVGKNMVPFVPLPTAGFPNSKFNTNAYSQTLSDDKGSARVDASTRMGSVFAYYYRDHFNGSVPFFRHTNVPGFSSTNTGFTQMANMGLTSTLSPSTVNDIRLVYFRVSGTLGQPSGGVGAGKIASLGFNSGWSASGGLGAVVPSYEGVPYITSKTYVFGTTNSTIRQANNSVQAIDNFMKTFGTHTFKAGVDYHYDQINERNTSCPNGCFTFKGSETGSDFADILIGAPTSFSQAGETQLNSRSNYLGLFAQDSWRARPSLTLNYGVRWDLIQPWYDSKNMLSTFVPGEQSKVFPNAPTGMVFPGDPGIPKTIAGTHHYNFAPRVGVAYAPASGKYSVRLGYGLFYTSTQQVTGMNTAGGPPFNVYYGSPVPPVMDSPYLDRFSGNFEGIKFPVPEPPSNVSASNPDKIAFDQFVPISGSFGIYPKNVLPYAQNYELSLQRALGKETVLTVSYVGTSGRHLLTLIESNPGNQALCLQLSDPRNVSEDSATCGPFGEDQEYTTASGADVPGTRSRFGTLDLGSNPWMQSSASSAYDSLQVSLKHRDRYENFLVGYTYSKSMDNGSSVFDATNPYNPSKSRALSFFNIPQNFVASYTVALPFEKFLGQNNLASRIVGGWSVSGITSLVTGEVIALSEYDDDNSLSGTFNDPVDTPSYANNGSKLFQSGVVSKNPRKRDAAGNQIPYFNPNFFTTEPVGQIGNAMPRFFQGPGKNNTDLALVKNTTIAEGNRLVFRAEAFNVFNHAQFLGVDGEIGDDFQGGFGYNNAARDPRIMQLALKWEF